MTKSRGILARRRRWTDSELAILRKRYPSERTDRLAQDLGRKLNTVYAKATQIGLAKTPEYLASPNACRLRRGDNVGAPYRFKPGQVPPNKGTRRPGWFRGRMRETQFKKGQRPHTWKPIGSYRINADGYVDQKITDTGYTQRDWVGVHRLAWIKAHGPIPPGMRVAFLPGRHTTDPERITADGLELVSAQDLMRRNTVHNLPKPLAQLVQLRGALIRQINKRVNHGQHDRRAKGASVRHAEGAQEQGHTGRHRARKSRVRRRRQDHRERQG